MGSSVYDIARRHVRLPINKDAAALKQVLRDWVAYAERTPLQQKQTFAAELHIKVVRDTAVRAKQQHQRGALASSFFSSWGNQKKMTSSSHHGVQYNSTQESAAAAGAFTHIYVKRVPLQLWTALLPWETQRGLSLSTLRLPPHDDEAEGHAAGEACSSAQSAVPSSSAGSTATLSKKKEPREVQEEEEEDPYGVVTRSAGSPAHDASHRRQQQTNDDAAAVVSSTISSGVATGKPVPGMLFVMDALSSSAQGVNFWSGAIIHPIDVLFIAATFPSSVAQSGSFAALRRRESTRLVEDNMADAEVLQRYFPSNEIMTKAAEFRVKSYGHLNPFPSLLARLKREGAMWKEVGDVATAATEGISKESSGVCHNVGAPPPAQHEQPARYVLESVRYVVRDAVQQAVKESAQAAGLSFEDADSDKVELELELVMSPALKEDIMAKAQMQVHYVKALEDNIAYHLKRLSSAIDPSSEEQNPLQGGDDAAGAFSASSLSGKAADSTRKMQVWLSETESAWMTQAELASHQAGQTKKRYQTPQEAQREAEAEENEEELYESNENNERGEEAGAAEVVFDGLDTVQEGANPVAADKAEHAEVQPAKPGATSAARSIAHQSPQLLAEDEGRPSYLAPSFTGRHDAPFFQSTKGALVASADKLARYPKTHSHMPVLPPVDYELCDLCLRLGVGLQSVLYYYYERILAEWRKELKVLITEERAAAKAKASDKEDTRAASGTPSRRTLSEADVRRMLTLVRDPTLQLSEELTALVEAVADRMGVC